MSFNITKTKQKRVVIVGGGFGGLKLANELHQSGFQVVLIDKNNHHQFPPLIYQVASSGLEPSSISFPFRKLFNRHQNIHFRMAEAKQICPDKKILQTSIGNIDYDYLVLAAGTTSNFFGNKQIEAAAMPMKTLSEAMGLRNTLLSNLERSVTCGTTQERRELLNVVIVGGGATGVEIAGAIAEMKRYILPKDYPEIDHSDLHIFLIEAGNRLLSGMSAKSSRKAEEFLRRMGVNIYLNKRVTDFVAHKVILEDGMEIPTQTFIWVSGVRANEIGNLSSEAIGHGGRILVDANNQIKGMNHVFCIGDQC